jgi:nucleotide-binding universal stress UspA family protein
MNTRASFWLAFALPFTALIAPITVHAQSAAPAAIRVGTYDSRAIAVAWVSSNMHRQWLAQLVAERNEAKAAGDEKKVQEIQARGGAEQARVHEQGFSTASVAGLMEKISQEIPSVAKEAGVALIVSKWEVVYKDPAIEYVDVTMPLVRKFSADPRIIGTVTELMKHPPIPLDQLPADSD